MKDLGPKAAVSAATKAELSKVLGAGAWRRIKTALHIECSFRCCLCRKQYGASFLAIRHLSAGTPKRDLNLLKGLRVFCLSCLD